MTPDEDERMERAERIRRLRERGVGGDGGGTDGAREGADTAGEDADGAREAADGVRQDADDRVDEDNPDEDGEVVHGGSDAASGGWTGGAAGATGVTLPNREAMEAAIASGSAGAAAASIHTDDDSQDFETDPREEADAALAAAKRIGTATEAYARVLEFTLGDEVYCIDIEGVEEIVKREEVTRVPNTPAYVAGVVDLRGQITTILDAKCLLDIDEEGSESLVVVFAPDAYGEQGALGWIVDEVRQVRPISEDQVRAAHSDDEYVEGILDIEETDELVVWIRPDEAIRLATDAADEE